MTREQHVKSYWHKPYTVDPNPSLRGMAEYEQREVSIGYPDDKRPGKRIGRRIWCIGFYTRYPRLVLCD